MKTEIVISGQIMGNSKLRSAIITAECEERRGMFNSYILTFKSKKEATKALSQGYQSMCREMPEEKGASSGIRYSRGSSLSYDASRAVISTNN
jgi:hypothetical protein